MTEKLYYTDSHLYEFDAEVKQICAVDGNYIVILDRSAFFPEGGGQPGDSGFIGESRVFDTKTEDNEILHYIKNKPDFCSGQTVHCVLDKEQRFARMQAHSGEHILSGLAATEFGAQNVGFHMDGCLMTVDFNRHLSKDELDMLELKANEIVYANKKVKAYFPTVRELSSLEYRSKIDIFDGVRLVEIEDCDICACCAPHVNYTGEIGLIKILSGSSHRGGIRLTVVCGKTAYEDYREKYENVISISTLLKTPHNEAYKGVVELNDKLAALNYRLVFQQNQLIGYIYNSIGPVAGNLVLEADNFDADALRRLADKCKDKCGGVFVAVSKKACKEYYFSAASLTNGLDKYVKEINCALNGRGGGKGNLIQGTFFAEFEEIKNYFEKFKLTEEY